jgi:hypothetical protein
VSNATRICFRGDEVSKPISNAVQYFYAAAGATVTILVCVNSLQGAMPSNRIAPDRPAEHFDASPDQKRSNPDELAWQIAQADPNLLTPEQRQTIIELARISGGAVYQIIVASDAACTDCVGYARAFEQTLRDAGWLVRFKTLAGAGAGASLREIALMVPDIANPPREARVLQRALNSAQINVDLIRAPRAFLEFPNDSRPILYIAARPRHH